MVNEANSFGMPFVISSLRKQFEIVHSFAGIDATHQVDVPHVHYRSRFVREYMDACIEVRFGQIGRQQFFVHLKVLQIVVGLERDMN